MGSRRSKIGLVAAGSVLTAFSALVGLPAGWAKADFCGAREDPFVCTARLNAGPPNAAEVQLLNSINRHWIPNSNQQILTGVRTMCEMDETSNNYRVRLLSQYLGVPESSAGQVFIMTLEYVCPWASVLA